MNKLINKNKYKLLVLDFVLLKVRFYVHFDNIF